VIDSVIQSHEGPRLPVDAHVHFHREQLVESTLDAAAKNFARFGAPTAPLLGALLLAQGSREHVFEQLAETASCGTWRLLSLPLEPQTIVASSRGRQIAIICGRQIRCELGLEVLALGTTTCYPDGSALEDTLDRVRADGALAVVPWAFGKWTGRAGALVRDLFGTSMPDSLFAGDNGGRLRIWGMPKLLQVASRAGFRLLPGSDPFPFGADYRRVGAFGFRAPITPDPSMPWQSLRDGLADTGFIPEPYGRALTPFRFFFNQTWVQLYNRGVRHQRHRYM